MNEDVYFVWSHEHSAWWRAGGMGYTNRLSEAGQFSRPAAMRICIGAMSGSRECLNELPVKREDVIEMRDHYVSNHPTRDEDWM